MHAPRPAPLGLRAAPTLSQLCVVRARPLDGDRTVRSVADSVRSPPVVPLERAESRERSAFSVGRGGSP